MFVASRVLHTLALQNQTGPEWLTRRLRQCNAGVPRRAVLATALVALLGYMGRTGNPGEVSAQYPLIISLRQLLILWQRLSEIASNCTVTYLIMFATIAATYLAFFKA
jgi:amino acid transporter